MIAEIPQAESASVIPPNVGAAAAELKTRREARRKLIPYAEYTFTAYKAGWHQTLTAEWLEKVSWGILRSQGYAGLIIEEPPRHGKSELVSVRFPAWHLGNNNQDQIIHASYAISLSQTFSEATRNTIKGAAHQRLWPSRLLKDNSTEWQLEGKENFRPSFIAAGVGGGISGQGANVLIIDDPVKNDEEASSVVMREKVWNWWLTTARTRLQPGGQTIVVMTRWHEDDLVGRLLAQAKSNPTADQWVVVELPAVNTAEEGQTARIYSTDGKIDIKVDAYKALWPEAYDHVNLAGTKASSGPRTWNALYQQRPTAIEGGIILRRYFKFYLRPTDPQPMDQQYPVHAVLPKEFEEQIQSWDMAFKDSKESAFVVGQVWGRKAADKFLLAQKRERMDFTASLAAVKQMKASWPETYTVLIEDKANGPAIISSLRHDISGIIEIEPRGSKEARLQAVAPEYESGNVYVPHPSIAPWVLDYIEELVAAPNGTFWDQCDASSQALDRMRSTGGGFYAYLQQEAEKKKAAEMKVMREDATDSLISEGVNQPTPEQVDARVQLLFGHRLQQRRVS